MGKIIKRIKKFFDKIIERSFQKQANRMFMKHQVKTTDGDNT
jgi:hypothetical protein